MKYKIIAGPPIDELAKMPAGNAGLYEVGNYSEFVDMVLSDESLPETKLIIKELVLFDPETKESKTGILLKTS